MEIEMMKAARQAALEEEEQQEQMMRVENKRHVSPGLEAAKNVNFNRNLINESDSKIEQMRLERLREIEEMKRAREELVDDDMDRHEKSEAARELEVFRTIQSSGTIKSARFATWLRRRWVGRRSRRQLPLRPQSHLPRRHGRDLVILRPAGLSGSTLHDALCSFTSQAGLYRLANEHPVPVVHRHDGCARPACGPAPLVHWRDGCVRPACGPMGCMR